MQLLLSRQEAEAVCVPLAKMFRSSILSYNKASFRTSRTEGATSKRPNNFRDSLLFREGQVKVKVNDKFILDATARVRGVNLENS
jgi:hypothetical protein